MKTPALGTPIRARAYMVRRSSLGQWWARHPRAEEAEAPTCGFKTWKREGEPFSGVFAGVRVLTIKQWWWKPGWYVDDPEQVFESKRMPITFWLIAHSIRAKLRYVLPQDVTTIAAHEGKGE